MAVKLRMTRMGRRHRPYFRINAIESRNPRDGRILEKLGHLDPIEKDPAKQLVIDMERVKYWLDKGAIPSETVAQIIVKQGVPCPWYEQLQARRKKAATIARKAGKPYGKAEKTAAGHFNKPEKKEE
jgi:small subunit ribosomal protein S16